MGYRSSVNEMDHFIGSHVYDDIMEVFEDWLDGALDKMEHVDDANEIYRCQGSIQVMRDVLQWAENFRDLLEEEKDDN